MKFFFILLGMITLIFLSTLFIFRDQIQVQMASTPKLQIPITASSGAIAFLESAKSQIGVVTSYDHSNGYYGNGGYPPVDTGVCSDVIWRAYSGVGMDFREKVITEIKKNPTLYGNDTDNNINYRRVKRLFTYFSKNSTTLTGSLIPWDIKNLTEWQPWDIVIFDELPSNHLWHIGIISDIRRADGVPYMIDNHGRWVNIRITPLDWSSKIIGHFRVF